MDAGFLGNSHNNNQIASPIISPWKANYPYIDQNAGAEGMRTCGSVQYAGNCRDLLWYLGRAIDDSDRARSGDVEPAWPRSVGDVVMDGGIRWECMGTVDRVGGHVFIGSNAPCPVLNAYTEGDCYPNASTGLATFVGGLWGAGWTPESKTGVRVNGNFVDGSPTFRTTNALGKHLSAALGNVRNGILSLQSSDVPWLDSYYSLNYGQLRQGCWEFHYSGLDGYAALSLTDAYSPLGPGNLLAQNGARLGPGMGLFTSAFSFSYDVAAPPTRGTQGDITIGLNNVVDQEWHWVALKPIGYVMGASGASDADAWRPKHPYQHGDVVAQSATPPAEAGAAGFVSTLIGYTLNRWEANTVYSPSAVNDPAPESIIEQDGRCLQCTAVTLDGKTGASKPDFSRMALNDTLIDHNVVWTCVQGGVSGRTSPAWRTGMPVRTQDGTCLWQSTGVSAVPIVFLPRAKLGGTHAYVVTGNAQLATTDLAYELVKLSGSPTAAFTLTLPVTTTDVRTSNYSGMSIAIANTTSWAARFAPCSGPAVLPPGAMGELRYDGTSWHLDATSGSYAGRNSIDVTGITGSVTLDAAQGSNRILEITGMLTGDITVFMPQGMADGHEWTFANLTTGLHTLTVATYGGSGFPIAQSKRAIGYCDGSPVLKRATPDT